MKTILLLLAVLVCACEKPDPIAAALSTKDRVAKIITVAPTNSRCPDSLNWQAVAKKYELYIRVAKTAVNIPRGEYTERIDSTVESLGHKYDSLHKKFISQTSPRPGFSLVRYTVNREPDTLTAVLDPSFRVVWPR